MGSHDPEDIDQETQAFYRNIYKLEKQFADLPAPGALASQVTRLNIYICFPIKKYKKSCFSYFYASKVK